jgi:hypothetical protein
LAFPAITFWIVALLGALLQVLNVEVVIFAEVLGKSLLAATYEKSSSWATAPAEL